VTAVTTTQDWDVNGRLQQVYDDNSANQSAERNGWGQVLPVAFKGKT
jgi:hypothetical protein